MRHSYVGKVLQDGVVLVDGVLIHLNQHCGECHGKLALPKGARLRPGDYTLCLNNGDTWAVKVGHWTVEALSSFFIVTFHGERVADPGAQGEAGAQSS